MRVTPGQLPARCHEVEYWVTGYDPPAVLLLRSDLGGILALPRKGEDGRGPRLLLEVLPRDIERLRQRGWRGYRTHMLPPEEPDAEAT